MAVKNISRLLRKLNEKSNYTYYFYMNLLNGFWTGSERDKSYQCCSSNGHVKVKITFVKEKWLKFFNGQYQFKVYHFTQTRKTS